jgi:competence protein ComGC
MEIIRDLWGFLKERKKWWLLPMIVMLLLIGVLIFSSGSAVAPFIYTLF